MPLGGGHYLPAGGGGLQNEGGGGHKIPPPSDGGGYKITPSSDGGGYKITILQVHIKGFKKKSRCAALYRLHIRSFL